MIRIVGLQRDDFPEREFVLLQNQGGLRIDLRGHVIVSDSAVTSSDLGTAAHIFSDDVTIPPGMYVLLFTGCGIPKWAKTKDGALVYYTYMDRERTIWSHCKEPLHVLATQHTYTERREAISLR